MPSSGFNKFRYEDVKQVFEQYGFELLETSYVSNGTPMDAICPCGNKTKIRLSDVQYGRRCQQCKAKTNSEKLRTPGTELTLLCEQHGCQYLTSWIQCKKTRLRYICKCGQETEAYLTNFKKFPNCWECGKKKKSGYNCYMWNPDRDAVAQAKYWRKACERIVRRCLKAAGSVKGDRTQKLLGYTPDQLKEHIENHPNGYGKQPHHIDHVFPVQAFIEHDIFDLRLINRLDNLQPLPGIENLSKADDYDEALFLEWLKNE